MTLPPHMIAYLSHAKLEQVYGQITEFDVQKLKQTSDSKIKGTVGAKIDALLQLFSGTANLSAQRQTASTKEGTVNSFNKLRHILAYYNDGGHIADLVDCIDSKASPDGTILYRYNGHFQAAVPSMDDKPLNEFVTVEEKKENRVTFYHWSGLVATSGMCLLTSKVRRYTIQIACSYKYFSDMGGSRVMKGRTPSDSDTVDIHPHSGNHHFFAGEGSADFDSFLFITGQSGKTLFGSPLVLFTNFQLKF